MPIFTGLAFTASYVVSSGALQTVTSAVIVGASVLLIPIGAAFSEANTRFRFKKHGYVDHVFIRQAALLRTEWNTTEDAIDACRHSLIGTLPNCVAKPYCGKYYWGSSFLTPVEKNLRKPRQQLNINMGGNRSYLDYFDIYVVTLPGDTSVFLSPVSFFNEPEECRKAPQGESQEILAE
ncbi:hypothetical protein ED733_004239 [Metarhizium rileyi]|uniref:Uncharacterized protein n=1 Tax=Metarhizium rileyi (strain RCEF 4871) TaxID=1649241 RepID=A0A5C6G7D7_METRR|nr:hypothetical protein ED733_004239 [Metarhizium rileyi]